MANRSRYLTWVLKKKTMPIYSYFQADNIGSVKKIEIINTILHESI